MKVGDVVSWISQSQGFKTRKMGKIVAVVPAGVDPHTCIPAGYHCNSSAGYGMHRREESYLVEVEGKGKALYWPRISAIAHLSGGEAVCSK